MTTPARPTPKGEANKTATDAAARDATRGPRQPVAATQDSGGDGSDTAPTEGGTAQGVPTGRLDQDHDGVAETPEVGQAHVASAAKPARQAPQNSAAPQPRNSPRALTDRESEMAKNPKGSCEPEDEDEFDRPPGQRGAMRSAQSFEDVCEEVGKGIKKLVDAGLGGQAAADIAFKIWEKHCE